MGYPAGLAVVERPPPGGWGDGRPTAVLVHGSLDRAASFGRTARRLDDLGVVAYDRRGYQGSRDGSPPLDLAGHVHDLLGVVAEIPGPRQRVTAVGHSLGGDVVLAAALAAPDAFASVGAYEPPMPWLGVARAHSMPNPGDADPATEAERFFKRMLGTAAWERMHEEDREARRADGPALLSDLRGIRSGMPFDVTALAVPAVFGRGGTASTDGHRDTVAWLADHVEHSEMVEIPDAAHGAHLTHPDAFAGLVRVAVRLGEQRRHVGGVTLSDVEVP